MELINPMEQKEKKQYKKRILDNPKRLQEINWPQYILEMNILDFNQYLKMHKLTKDDTKLIKIQRRRVLNRLYARISRGKKRANFNSNFNSSLL
jgi:hypothetical protein